MGDTSALRKTPNRARLEILRFYRVTLETGSTEIPSTLVSRHPQDHVCVIHDYPSTLSHSRTRLLVANAMWATRLTRSMSHEPRLTEEKMTHNTGPMLHRNYRGKCGK